RRDKWNQRRASRRKTHDYVIIRRLTSLNSPWRSFLLQCLRTRWHRDRWLAGQVAERGQEFVRLSGAHFQPRRPIEETVRLAFRSVQLGRMPNSFAFSMYSFP